MTQDLNCDVLICGAGPSGIAAAVAASRMEAKVLLVERYGFLGGAASAALVNPFMVPKINDEMLVKGIFLEILEEMKKRGAAVDGSLFDQPHTAFDPEMYKLLLFEILEKNDVKLLLHSQVSAAIVKDNVLKGVITTGKSGEIRIFSKMIVDATGDADVAYMSGVETVIGREKDGLTQPASLMFRIAGVDESLMPSMDNVNILFRKAKTEGKIRTPRENLLWFETTRKGELHFNSTRIPKTDGTSVFDLTKAETEGRKQIESIYSFLKSDVPGFADSFISAVAPQVGIRESRRIKGEFTLTGEDVLSGRKADDPVAKCNYPIDIHSPDGRSTTFTRLGPAVYYEIPYKCMVPKKIDNLLVTGRAISVTHEALASTRVMPTCMALGQAAGIAAAICVNKSVKPRRLDYRELKDELNSQGAEMRR